MTGLHYSILQSGFHVSHVFLRLFSSVRSRAMHPQSTFKTMNLMDSFFNEKSVEVQH